ncbi:hypothetical protein F5Y03DRAFT_149382 [Xylaria venustula]|nr:hypothetical protein F5Y03DRAFT_149382 [Xylaria venustula]
MSRSDDVQRESSWQCRGEFTKPCICMELAFWDCTKFGLQCFGAMTVPGHYIMQSFPAKYLAALQTSALNSAVLSHVADRYKIIMMGGQSQQEILRPRARFHNNKNYGGDQIIGLKLTGGLRCWVENRLAVTVVVVVVMGVAVGVAGMLVFAFGLSLGLVSCGAMAWGGSSPLPAIIPTHYSASPVSEQLQPLRTLSISHGPAFLDVPGTSCLAPDQVRCRAAALAANDDPCLSTCPRPPEAHPCFDECNAE